jgi:hypothetical protein
MDLVDRLQKTSWGKGKQSRPKRSTCNSLVQSLFGPVQRPTLRLDMPFTPHDAAQHMIARATALVALAARLSRKDARQLVGTEGGRPVRDDLRRLAIVMAVAALDTYMHRLVVSRAYSQAPMPRTLADMTVRFGDLVNQADAAVVAHREARDTRPRVPAKRLLRERLLRETFQRYERVSEALAMAGKPKSWKEIAKAMPSSPTQEVVKMTLDTLVERRNAIVHEGDYERLDRPQRARVATVSPREARQSVKFISDLIEAIHQVTT